MKVIAVLGSPRAESRSTLLTYRILDGAKEAGHEVIVYNVNDMNIRGCQSCRMCKDNDIDCVLNDDLKPYWAQLHECGALIVSAPNYCSQVCGPMITYMNRHYCVMGKNGTRLVPGQTKLVGVFAQGGPAPNALAEANYDWYLGDFLARKMVLTEKFVIDSSTDLAPNSEMMNRAYALGKSL